MLQFCATFISLIFYIMYIGNMVDMYHMYIYIYQNIYVYGICVFGNMYITSLPNTNWI